MTIRNFLARVMKIAGVTSASVSQELMLDYLNEAMEAVVNEFDFPVYIEGTVDAEGTIDSNIGGMFCKPKHVFVDKVRHERALASKLAFLRTEDLSPDEPIWAVQGGNLVVLPFTEGASAQVTGLMADPRYTKAEMDDQMVDAVTDTGQVLAVTGHPLAVVRYRMLQLIMEEKGALDRAQYFGVAARRAEEDARKHFETQDTTSLGYVQGYGA